MSVTSSSKSWESLGGRGGRRGPKLRASIVRVEDDDLEGEDDVDEDEDDEVEWGRSSFFMTDPRWSSSSTVERGRWHQCGDNGQLCGGETGIGRERNKDRRMKESPGGRSRTERRREVVWKSETMDREEERGGLRERCHKQRGGE